MLSVAKRPALRGIVVTIGIPRCVRNDKPIASSHQLATEN